MNMFLIIFFTEGRNRIKRDLVPRIVFIGNHWNITRGSFVFVKCVKRFFNSMFNMIIAHMFVKTLAYQWFSSCKHCYWSSAIFHEFFSGNENWVALRLLMISIWGSNVIDIWLHFTKIQFMVNIKRRVRYLFRCKRKVFLHHLS